MEDTAAGDTTAGDTAGRDVWAGRGSDHRSERGSGTILAAGLGLVLISVTTLLMLLAQSAVMASRAAAAADLAALAAADAMRGVVAGEPCTVAVDVAAKHSARVVACLPGPAETVEIRTELAAATPFGNATGRARAGPPP